MHLIYYKKGSGKTRVEYADAVEEALCFGWIDSTVRAIDESRYMQWFCPRKPKSTWSKLNKSRVQKMIEQGLMMPAGMEKIEMAKANGQWTSLDKIDELEIPPDLDKAFKKNKAAFKYFNEASRHNRWRILHRINSAKLPETRAKRITEMVKFMGEGKKIF